MKESDIQRAIIDLLAARRIFYWRNNSGAWKVENRFIRFGQPGSPDIFCLYKGKCYGIEVKNEKGKQSDLQQAWEISFQFAGGIYILARKVEDVESILK